MNFSRQGPPTRSGRKSLPGTRAGTQLRPAVGAQHTELAAEVGHQALGRQQPDRAQQRDLRERSPRGRRAGPDWPRRPIRPPHWI